MRSLDYSQSRWQALIFTVQVGFLTQPGSGGSFVDENGELEKWMYVLYTGVWATAS